MDIMKPNYCRSCGKTTTRSDIFCWHCGYQLRSRAATPVLRTGQAQEIERISDELSGIKGWLAWFSVGVALTPILALYGLYMDFVSFAVVAGQGFGGIAILEILANLAQFTLAIWSLILLAQRRKLAIRILITLMLVSVAISLVDLGFVVYLQSRFGLVADHSQSAATARTLLTALIWIPYFLRSRRVKATLTA